MSYRRALDLDGSHYATAADHADLDVGAGDFTLEFLLKRTRTATLEILYSKRNAGGTIGYGSLIDVNNRPSLWLIDAGNQIDYFPASLVMNDAAWHYLGLSKDRDANCVFVQDAATELDATAGNTGDLDNDGDLHVGILTGGVWFPFAGGLGMVRLTKRAKSAVEMQAESAYLLAGQPPGLLDAVFMVRFQDSLEDDGPGNHDLTWQGGGAPSYVDGLVIGAWNPTASNPECLVEEVIAWLTGIVETTTVDCTVPLGIAGELSLSLTAGHVLDLQVAIEIGGEFLVSTPAVTVPLVVGTEVSWGLSLASGPSIAKPVLSSVNLEVGGSLSLTKVALLLGIDVSLAVSLEVGANFGIVTSIPVQVTVALRAGLKVEGSLGLVSELPDTPTFTLLTKPVAIEVGADLGLEAVPSPTAKVLSGIVTMEVGGSMGLVANLLPVTVVLLNGGTAIGGSFLESSDVAEIFETWVLTGNKFSASVYSGFDFNSYARYRGRNYAAGPDGIYLLEGADDDGEEIHPGVRLVTNFGTEKHKRLRSIHLGKCGDNAKVRIKTDKDEKVFEPGGNGDRAAISRNLQAQEFTLDIVDFEQLSHLEIEVLPLNKR